MYTLPNTYKSFPTQSMSCQSSELLGVYLFILLQFKRGGIPWTGRDYTQVNRNT